MFEYFDKQAKEGDYPLLSLVIPVHNAHKYITNTVNRLFQQDYPNLEIILVENGSSDDTWQILNHLKQIHTNKNLIIVKNKEAGTSLARKKGIELAHGRYITFSDQDDYYIHSHSLTAMVRTMQKSQSQICQFGHYTSLLGIKKFNKKAVSSIRYSRQQLLEHEVIGIVSSNITSFSPSVWSKIYEADILKDITSRIDHPLFYGEDMYLNTLAFFNPKVQYAAVSPKGYYVWNTGIGTSGTDEASINLFKEYAYIKPRTLILAEENNAGKDVLTAIQSEIIFFFRYIILDMIENHKFKEEVISTIQTLDELTFVQNAKLYFRMHDQNHFHKELEFLDSDYKPEEYYRYVSAQAKCNIKKQIRRWIKNTIIRH